MKLQSNRTFNYLFCGMVIVGLSVVGTNAYAQQEKIDQLLQIAEKGDANAQFDLGFRYQEGEGVAQDLAEAAKWYHLAAEQGKAEAQVNLGIMYQQGEGVPQDYIEAVKWYRLAAEQGEALAQSNLGRMYTFGEGVARDDVEAAKWLRLAAEQGRAAAQHNLGLQYQQGLGVPQDYIEAHKWFNLAASQLSGEKRDLAVSHREETATMMTPAQIAEAQRLAREWAKAHEGN